LQACILPVTILCEAYGFFEITGVAAAVDAIDIMCKSAGVCLVTWEKKLGGRLVTIIIKGEVAAVQASIDGAISKCIKKPVAHCVIPAPHEEVLRRIYDSANLVAASPFAESREPLPEPKPERTEADISESHPEHPPEHPPRKKRVIIIGETTVDDSLKKAPDNG